MTKEPTDDTTDEERALREAEADALAESGLGSGLLTRQETNTPAEAIPVLKLCPQCGQEYETAARFCPNDGRALRPKGSDSLLDHVIAERYHILKRIGEGGMGRVYLGEHVKMNRQCAIKVMSPQLLNDHESAARFGREASNAARIIHPNVAAVFDYGESDGLVYLVMEYVDGEPLARIIQREAPLQLERALDLSRQIADGLGAAHELGIVHRDLKPDNILISRNKSGKEIAKVVDFGIAKAIQEGAGEGLTRTGQVIGTPEFMSPEQLVGDPVDARSDFYALGCILYLMLTGAPAFAAPTREQMITRRLAEGPPHAQELDPGIPDSVDAIVSRLLARSPADRYGSAAEVRDALSGSHVRRAGFQPVDAVSRLTPRSAPTVAFLHATQATTELTHIPASKPVRRVPVVIGVFALAAGAAAFVLLRTPGAVDGERARALKRDSVESAALKDAGKVAEPTPPPVVTTTPIAVASAPVASASAPAVAPPVDSTKKAAKPHVADTVAHTADREVGAVHSAVTRYGNAIKSGDIKKLLAVFPGMSPQQQNAWEKNVFSQASAFTGSLTFGDTKITGDSAHVKFSLLLSWIDKDTKASRSQNFRNDARLLRRNGAWQIAGVQ